MFLGYQILKFSNFQIAMQWIRRDWIPLAIIGFSVGILAFWNLRYTKHSTTRRAFSVANVNDFFWRKRVAAYEGALQMMADKPWFGFGWNIPEPLYDKFYRKPKVDEGMAIQMNDYFMLGATLGIPALGCFIAYLWLSLTKNSGVRSQESGGRNQESEDRNQERGNSRNDSESCILDSDYLLRMTCRAGAIVLLVGFFFDGGLFKLATGATFWILIELGSEPLQRLKSNVQSSGNAASAVGAASL
jgi:hypothetical protein